MSGFFRPNPKFRNRREKVIAVVLLLFASLYMAHWAEKEWALGRNGEISEGRVVRKWVSFDTRSGNVHYVEFTYKSPAAQDEIRATGTTSERNFQRLELGGPIQIRYLPQYPDVSEPWDGTNRGRMFAALMFCLLGLFAAWRSSKQAVEGEDSSIAGAHPPEK